MLGKRSFTKYSLSRIKKSKQKSLLEKHNGLDKPLFIIVFTIFLIHSLTMLIPVIWLFLSALKGKNEFLLGNALELPKDWLFSNFKVAFSQLEVNGVTFGGMLVNSLWYTAFNVIGYLMMPCVVGYILAKYTFRGRDFLYSLIIFVLTLPIVGTGAAGMRLTANLGLYDNPLHVIVNWANGFTGHFLIFYGFFKSVSWAYAESAQIDGAGHFKAFFKVMLPQAVPIFLTYAITDSIGVWNEYENVLLYYPSYPTLSAGLFTYRSNMARGNFPVYYAGLIIAMIPTIGIFSIFSKKIMTSISVGGLKG